jgi:hypothetical protein
VMDTGVSDTVSDTVSDGPRIRIRVCASEWKKKSELWSERSGVM